MSTPTAIDAEVTRGPFDPGGQPVWPARHELEVSLFGWNAQGGLSANNAVLTDLPRYRDYWHWPIASELLKEAERQGFDAQVQFGLWSGWGGTSGWNDAALDFATAAAASAVATESLGLFSTMHVGYAFHPLHLAKIAASIDFISGGRLGINVVAGQVPRDYRQFGFDEMPSSDVRYAIADEATTLMKYLWTSEVPVNFEGEYFRAQAARVAPRPARRPRPLLMNAGMSDTGLDFACRQVDCAFVSVPGGEIASLRESVEKIHALAAKYGRKVRVAVSCYAVVGATDEEAARTVEWLEENVDREAVAAFLNIYREEAGIELVPQDDPYLGVGRDQFMHIGLGMQSFQLFGGYETVANTLRELSAAGVDHVVVNFFDPMQGVKMMGEHVFPLLAEAGLR
ncbi:MAG: LLM class flavin-dependent oxidoreductase [Actinobacteria bacterium]|nr:LLM class flavin-dependent oxidoreductase [Actinomycetota bacterium]